MTSNKHTQSPGKKTATSLPQGFVSSIRQRLATSDINLSNSVSTSSPGLQKFWTANNIRNLAAAGIGNLVSPTPPIASPSSDSKIHRSSTQIDPNSVTPDSGRINSLPSVLVMSPSVDSPESAPRPPALAGTILSERPILKASDELGRTATTPFYTSSGLAQNPSTAPAGSPTADVESPLFALYPSVNATRSPLKMNDADFSVLTSPEPDLYAQSHADGYHCSSFVSNVTTEGNDDIGLLRAIEQSGGDPSPPMDAFQEKERMHIEEAAFEAYQAARDELQAAFHKPPDLVDSPAPVVETAVPNVPLSTVDQSIGTVASEVTDDVNKLLAALLQHNSALAAELSSLKAAQSNAKSSVKAVADNVDDVEEFTGSNEYDMNDSWIVNPQTPAFRTGRDSDQATQVGEITSAPPRLVPGVHGSESFEGWSGLDPGPWTGSPPPSHRSGPRPPIVSSHTQRVDDVLLNQFVADDEVPPDEPRTPRDAYADVGDLAVVVRKEDRLDPGRYGYVEQAKFLRKPMPTQFGVLPANVTEKTDKGNISPSMSIVERFDQHLADVKKTMEHLHHRDLVSLIYVPKKLPDVDARMLTSKLRASTRHDLLEGGGSVRLCILDSWSDITFDDVVLWQRMISLSHRNLTPHERDSDRILVAMVKQSCTTDFWNDIKLQRDESGLEGETWGGVMALYLSITTLFYTPEHTLIALRKHFQEFAKIGLTKTEGENVKVVAKHLGRVNLALRQGNGLQSELVGMVIQGFSMASCLIFREHFVKLSHTEAKSYYQAHRNRSKAVIYSQEEIFIHIKEILKEAVGLFEALTSQLKWLDQQGIDLTFCNVGTRPSTPVIMRDGMSCDNCESKEHLAPNCPEDRNPEVMKANREKRLAEELEEKEKSPQVNVATGMLEPWCDTCASNCNHSTEYHDQAQRPGFNLADVAPFHPVVLLQAALDARAASAPAASVPAAPAASAPAAAAAPSVSTRTVTAAQFSTFTARQNQLLESINRHGPDSALGLEARNQFLQLSEDLGAHFR